MALTFTSPSSPVSVRMLPSTVAGPSTTSKVTGRPEVATAFSVMGAAYTSWSVMASKSMNWASMPPGVWRTVKLSKPPQPLLSMKILSHMAGSNLSPEPGVRPMLMPWQSGTGSNSPCSTSRFIYKVTAPAPLLASRSMEIFQRYHWCDGSNSMSLANLLLGNTTPLKKRGSVPVLVVNM